MKSVLLTIIIMLHVSAISQNGVMLPKEQHKKLIDTELVNISCGFADSLLSNQVQEGTQISGKRQDESPIILYRQENPHWFHFKIQNTAEEASEEVLYFTNHFYDTLDLYVKRNEEWILLDQRGDRVHQYHHETTSRLNVFVIPFLPGEELECLVKMKENRKIVTEVYLMDINTFIRKTDYEHLGLGAYYGIMTFFMLTGILTFYLTRRKEFIYYTGFILFGMVASSTALGVWDRFLIGNAPSWSIPIHSAGVFAWILCQTKFVQLFLKIKERYPRYNRYLNGIYYGYAIIATILIIIVTTNDHKSLTLVMYLMIGVAQLSIIIGCIKMIRYERVLASMALGSLVPIFIGFAVYALIRNGVFYSEFWLNFIQVFLSSSLVLVISFALGISLSKELQMKVTLLEELAVQERIFMDKIETQRQEQQTNIAHVLHDSMGSTLRHIRFLIEKNELQKAQSEIGILSAEIRDLSHTMAPTVLDHLSLNEALQDLVEKQSSAEFKIIYYNANKAEKGEMNKRTKTILYNILQEIISNAKKHSGGDELNLVVDHNHGNFVLTAEDNGSGINSDSEGMGLGIASIKSRIAGLKGKVKVESTKGKGVFYFIEIPFVAEDD